jgi:hypothetical protein
MGITADIMIAYSANFEGWGLIEIVMVVTSARITWPMHVVCRDHYLGSVLASTASSHLQPHQKLISTLDYCKMT